MTFSKCHQHSLWASAFVSEGKSVDSWNRRGIWFVYRQDHNYRESFRTLSYLLLMDASEITKHRCKQGLPNFVSGWVTLNLQLQYFEQWCHRSHRSEWLNNLAISWVLPHGGQQLGIFPLKYFLTIFSVSLGIICLSSFNVQYCFWYLPYSKPPHPTLQ